MLAALLAIGGVATGTAATPGSTPSDHHIGVRVVDGMGELFDRRTGETFVVRGANYVFAESASGRRVPELFRVGAYDAEQVRRDFAALSERGYNTVRVFLDHCARQDAGCIGLVGGDGLDRAYMASVADLAAAAAEVRLYVLFTSNDLPDHGGYSEQANAVAGGHFAGYRNAFYLTPEAIDATRRYWRDIITALQELGAPLEHVLAWQLLNEQWMFADRPPLSLDSGIVTTTTGAYDMADADQKRHMVADGIVHYVAEVKEEILRHDPTALVTMGFFPPGAAPGWYADPVDALARADLDLLDFHAYPGHQTMAEVAAAYAIADHPETPVLLGEYGPFRSVYPDLEAAARAITRWQADSCRAGFDGWLYWTYLAADPSISDATWGLTDDDGYLLDLFAPDSNVDACAVVKAPFSNRALGARATASRSFERSGPRRAIDDDQDSAWIAGTGPPAWIRIDLPRPTTVAEIQLIVAQDPAGYTKHRIEFTGKSGRTTWVAQKAGRTRDGDVLVSRPPSPTRDVTSIRVTTARSPSWVAWREIRIFEEPQPGS